MLENTRTMTKADAIYALLAGTWSPPPPPMGLAFARPAPIVQPDGFVLKRGWTIATHVLSATLRTLIVPHVLPVMLGLSKTKHWRPSAPSVLITATASMRQ